MAGSIRPQLANLERIPVLGCGLYRTTRPLLAGEEGVGPDQLVFLHDHRPDELPQILLPVHNEANRWAFSVESQPVTDPGFLDGLVPLPAEGFYALLHDVALSDDPEDLLPANSLVMVGYNRQGHVILFPARFGRLEIRFPDRGYRFESTDILDALQPANFSVPQSGEERLLH